MVLSDALKIKDYYCDVLVARMVKNAFKNGSIIKENVVNAITGDKYLFDASIEWQNNYTNLEFTKEVDTYCFALNHMVLTKGVFQFIDRVNGKKLLVTNSIEVLNTLYTLSFITREELFMFKEKIDNNIIKSIGLTSVIELNIESGYAKVTYINIGLNNNCLVPYAFYSEVGYMFGRYFSRCVYNNNYTYDPFKSSAIIGIQQDRYKVNNLTEKARKLNKNWQSLDYSNFLGLNAKEMRVQFVLPQFGKEREVVYSFDLYDVVKM